MNDIITGHFCIMLFAHQGILEMAGLGWIPAVPIWFGCFVVFDPDIVFGMRLGTLRVVYVSLMKAFFGFNSEKRDRHVITSNIFVIANTSK